MLSLSFWIYTHSFYVKYMYVFTCAYKLNFNKGKGEGEPGYETNNLKEKDVDRGGVSLPWVYTRLPEYIPW